MRLIDADALKTHIMEFSCDPCKKYGADRDGIRCPFCNTGNLLAEIDDAPTADVVERKWIPVTERLPIPNERIGNVRKYYLIQNEYGDMMVACYDGEWAQIYRHEYCLDKVIAWIPLPEPYRKGTEDEHDL